MNTRTNTRGFTIIEVVLVLAIAALIFLMIFIALPALQRGQRDAARKSDVGTIAAAVNSYRSNHRNALPDESSDLDEYLDDLNQITGTIDVDDGVNSSEETLDTATVYVGAECNDDNDAVDSDSDRMAAVRTELENGGTYCQEV